MSKQSKVEHIVAAGAGKRLDRYLCEQFPDLSRSRIQSMIKEGAVTIMGRPVKASYPVEPGDVIELCIPEAKPLTIAGEDIPLVILYAATCLIINNENVCIRCTHKRQTTFHYSFLVKSEGTYRRFPLDIINISFPVYKS